ncbi:VOC family protein [Streptomyces sp. NPDC048349]|uniref:VOC family protein n=1 Tax=Streptomyces sp. NPDC048349 TaxID=3155486 RepID=UPI0034226FEE
MLTTDYEDGAPNWVDLGTPDIGAAARFYAGLFGWDFRAGGEEAGGYGMFHLGGKTVAGGAAVPADQGPAAWQVYFRTADADATAAAVLRAGGRVMAEPMDIRDSGRLAVFADPEGVGFGVWQPGRNEGLGAVTEVGSLCWTELYTGDIDAAAEFYHAVLGWQIGGVPFDGGTYTTVRPAGTTEEAAIGGLVPLATDPVEDAERPYWTPYFEVTDCDATAAGAEEAGGKVRMTPISLEGVGRMAKLADPFGARFAVIASVPPPPPGQAA